MELIRHQHHEVDEDAREDCVSVRVGWDMFEAFLESRGNARPRFTYLDGVLEFMSPSFNHELIASNLGRLLERWTEELGIDLVLMGSLTIKKKAKQAGVEPDKCYFRGSASTRRTPDLAIEVVWTAPLVDKLEVYRRLNVRELWVWEKGVLTPWILGANGYARGRKSRVLPEIDLKQLNRYALRVDQLKALRELLAAVRRG
ncbi:MAG: Uma2 family endonuclease [Archangium sp.]|nr:Uma2 family endonuclease [Archangium sp.]